MTNVFYKGFEAKVVAEVPSDFRKVIIELTEDLTLDRDQAFNIGAQWYVNKSDLEPLIYDRFVVGMHVHNKEGSMVGKISAFEYHTNTAVVISDKIDKYQQKRTRYVYNVLQLEEHIPDACTFKPGRWYKINHKHKLMAVQSVFDEGNVMLFNNNGEIVWKSIPKKTNLKELGNLFGIDAVKCLGRVE
jgi:hypothetical protein